MSLPVRKSVDPRDNAPLSAGVLVGIFAAVLAASQGLDPVLAVVVFVVIVAALLVSQFFTRPSGVG